MSDEFLVSVVQRCQQLVCIDITGCCNVTDDGLTTVATLAKLERLTIGYLDRITDSGLQDIFHVDKDACNSRSNNVMLKLIIGSTSIISKHESDDKLSPLLQIVNVDLSDRRMCVHCHVSGR
ncbi:hypothetical protein X777_11965 [Ooceraea biroi]|nr:hypothetical protein X777_11965 [Ooceraea biroi]